MKWMLPIGLVAVAAFALPAGCDSNKPDQGAHARDSQPASPADDGPGHAEVPDEAAKVQPLDVGAKAPTASLRRPDGQEVDLAARYSAKPTVLIFYRGGWCPYCNKHLSQVATAEPDLLAMGFQVLAISPDRPEELAKTVDKHHLNYQLLSDSDAVLARAFGLVFRVDDATIEKYHGYGIDLERSSGRDHHLLPVPAVYIVDTAGVIRFAHWNPDYKKRLAPEDLLKAAGKVRQAAPPPA